MANGIKIGNLDISSFKVGSSDCKVYLGDTKLYPIWTFIESNTQNVPNAVAIRIPSNTVLQGNHNIAFGDTQVNVYSLLYENGVWYNWRLVTDGQYTPSSKTPLTSVDGYYVIEFDDSYPFLGSDGDSSGQGGVNYTTFDIEIKEGGTQPTPPTPSGSCIDDSDGTWVTVDDNFNTVQAVYKLDFVTNLYDTSYPYVSVTIDLYDENQNNIGMVDVFYDEMNELSNVKVWSGSTAGFIVIYNEDEGEGEVDICSLFGKPLYLENVSVESLVYVYCVDSQCIQYCCNEWDEETGECIDYNYGCCEEEECMQYESIYLCSAFVENNNS